MTLNATSEVSDDTTLKDVLERNEQGYLWLCSVCKNQPTFETIYDLFFHKKSHASDNLRVEIEKECTSCQKSCNVEVISVEKNEVKSCNLLSTRLNDENNYEFDDDTACLKSPLSPASSDDIPLASLKTGSFNALKFSVSVKNKDEVSYKKKIVKEVNDTSGSIKSYNNISTACDINFEKLDLVSNLLEVKVENKNNETFKNSDLEGGKRLEQVKKDDKRLKYKGKNEKKECKISTSKPKTKHLCKICNTEFPSRPDLSVHKKTHLFQDTGCYKCETCGKLCPKYDNFTRHLTIHHSNREKSHQCVQCFASFYNLADLKRHMVLHLTVKPFRCEHCGEGFIRQDNLLIHAYKHTGIQYKKFACKDCDKVLNSPSALVMHSKTHSVKTVFCPEPGCKFSCYLQSQLRQHVRKHSGEKPFQCAKCGRCFARSNDMKNHVLNVHEGIRPFKCSSCPKEFAVIGNLKIHRITHTNERPYLCAQCGKFFNQSSSLRKHSIVMHNPWRTSNKEKKTKKIDIEEEKKRRRRTKESDETQNKGQKNKIRTTLEEEKIVGKEKQEDTYVVSNAVVGPTVIQEVAGETTIQVPQITVSLPIHLDHSQTFILPTVILEPGLIRNNI